MTLRYLAAPGAAAPSVRDHVLHFHAGLPKTATSLLQVRLFPCHRQIAYLGKFIKEHHFLSDDVERFVTETVRRNLFRPDRALARELFARSIQPLLGRGKAVLLSMEDGTHGSPRRRRAKFENLREVCGDCRLLITLRNPLEFVQSMYLQRLKATNGNSRHRFAKPWLPEFEQWMDDRWRLGEKGELTHLDYADYIADWQAIFGDDSVGILVFEQLKREPQAFLDQVTGALGIEPVVAASVVEGPPVNPSWTTAQLDALQRIVRSPLRRLRYRLATCAERRRMVGEVKGPTAKLALPDRWRDRICETTARGNRWLVEQRNLPLRELGYPV